MILHLYFVIRHQRTLERIFTVEKDETTIGRSPRSILYLLDPYVSRQHAVVIRTTGGFLIRDLGSRNGTRLNSKPLTEAILTDGDHVDIGPYSLRPFHDLTAAQLDAETAQVSTVLDFRSIVPDEIRESLTPRQRSVYDHFVQGFSEKEIASALELSVNTVHTHARAIYAMFAVSSRSELLARCMPQQRR